MTQHTVNGRDYALLFLVALIWSTSFGAIKLGVTDIGAATLASGRIVLAAMLLYGWLRWVRGERLIVNAMAIRHYAVVGIFGNTLPFTLIGIGEMTIDSALAAVLMGIMPIVTFVLAALVLPDERFTQRRLAGVLLGFLGLLVLLGFSALNQLGGELRAQLLVLLSAVSYAVTTIYVRRYVGMSGAQMATGAMVMAAVTSVLVAVLSESPLDMQWTPSAWWAIVYLGIFPTALASLLYFYLVRALGATTFSQVNYLIPVMGSLLGVVWLGESMQWRVFLALGLILLGIVLVRGRSKA